MLPECITPEACSVDITCVRPPKSLKRIGRRKSGQIRFTSHISEYYMLDARCGYLGRLWTERAEILHDHIVRIPNVDFGQKSRRSLSKICMRPVFGRFRACFGLPEATVAYITAVNQPPLL